MKKLLLAASLAGAAPLASALCQYPLDAAPEQYAGTTPFPYINLQSVEYTVLPVAGVVNYIAASDTGAQAVLASAGSGLPGGDVALPASGIVGVEFRLDRFPDSNSTGATINLTLGFATSNNVGDAGSLDGNPNPGATFGLMFTSANGVAWAAPLAYRRDGGAGSFANGASTAVYQPVPAGGFRGGIYLNMATRRLGYIINGIDYGYIGDSSFTLPAGVQSGLLLATGSYAINGYAINLGSVVGGSLVTDRSEFTQPFPAGTVDICGNGVATPLPPGLRLPNGKPYPGKGSPNGLQKFQSLPLPMQPLGLGLKAAR
jgi:hypothetical protein